MFNLKAIVLGIVLALASMSSAFAQCGTTAPANKFCGNDTGSQALATWKSVPTGALSAIGGGTVLGNRTGASAVPTAVTNPVLGIPGTSTGEVGLAGLTSGTAVLRAQAAAGSAVSLLPTSAGTLVSTASSPLVVNATTGLMTCPTCVTSSSGGAITGAAPIAVSAAGVVSINAPYVTLTASNGGVVYSGATNLAILAGTATARQMLQSGASTTPAWSTTTWPATSTINRILYSSAANVVGEITTANGGLLNTSSAGVPSITATPVLGVAGTTVGSLGFQNATSGTITLAPVTGALGAVTVSIPAATTRLMGIDTTDTMTGKTYDTAGSGNSLLIAGVAVTANSGTGAVVRVTGAALITPALGVATATSLAIGGAAIGSNGLAITGTSALGGAMTITSASASALTVGLNGATNPAFQIDASTGSSATGIKVTSKAAAAGVNLDVISSGTNEGLVINAKGNSGITIANTSTGVVDVGTGGGGLTVHGSFTATGLVGYTALQSAALATATQYYAGTASTLVPASVIYPNSVTITFGATTTFDLSTFINSAVTLTGNITTMTVTNPIAGKSGIILFIQDATGSRTTVWNSIFKFTGGVIPTLSTTANAVDALTYSCTSTTFCAASLIKDVR